MIKVHKIHSKKTEKNEEKSNELLCHNFIQSLGPLFAIERAIGIIRFHVKYEELLHMSGTRKFLIICLVAIVTILTYLYLIIVSSNTDGSTVFLTLKLAPSASLSVSYIVTAILYSFRMCDDNISVISSFLKLDSIFRISTNKKMYNATRNCVLGILAFIFCYITTFIIWYYFSTNLTIFEILLTSVLYFIQDIEILTFCFMMNTLKNRLNILNCCLKNMRHSSDYLDTISVYRIDSDRNPKTKGNTANKKSFPVSNLRELSIAYDIIGNTSKLINRVFNLQIFACLINTFFVTLLTLWMVLFAYQKQYLPRGLITTVCWDITHLIFILAISFVCQRILIARNDTIYYVNELVMDYGLPADTRAQAKVFMKLIDAWPLRIYVYNMFPVDITLIMKFISISTTYLIVLIQIAHF